MLFRSTHTRLIADDQILFRYANGNPNGSQDDIAGIVGGPNRNVMGMMPHPERATRVGLGSADGICLFRGIVATLTEARV